MSADLSRRALLRTALAVALAGPLPFAASAAAPEKDATADLIAAHRDALATFTKACNATDSVAIGREPTEEEWSDWEAASRIETAALDALCAHSPSTAGGRNQKVEYILRFLERSELSNAQHLALIRSAAA